MFTYDRSITVPLARYAGGLVIDVNPKEVNVMSCRHVIHQLELGDFPRSDRALVDEHLESCRRPDCPLRLAINEAGRTGEDAEANTGWAHAFLRMIKSEMATSKG